MVWYVIKKWRLIVGAMLLFATILGVRQYEIDTANAVANQNVVTPTIYEIRDSLSEYELQSVGIARNYALQMEATKEYVENSIYMQIPYDKVVVASLQYGVSGVEEVELATYVMAYCNYITSGKIGADIVEKYELDIESQYISELITVKSSVHNITTVADDFVGFVVDIKHCSVEEATELASMVQELINEYSSVLASQMGVHQIRLQNQSTGIKSEYSLFSYQRNIVGDYEGAIKEYRDCLGNLNANQRTVYDNWDVLMNSTEETVEENVDTLVENETVAEPQPVCVAINKTQIILGALIGLFISVICLMVYYIGTKKMRGTSDFANLSIETIGEVEINKKKKVFAVVDRLLNKIQYSNEKNYTQEKRMEMLAVSISLKCKQNDTNVVYLTGASLGEEQKQMLAGLIELLKEKGISAEIGENITRNADSLIKASEVKNIVLIESEHGSFFEDVAEEIRVCKNHELKVLGGILVRA